MYSVSDQYLWPVGQQTPGYLEGVMKRRQTGGKKICLLETLNLLTDAPIPKRTEIDFFFGGGVGKICFWEEPNTKQNKTIGPNLGWCDLDFSFILIVVFLKTYLIFLIGYFMGLDQKNHYFV